MSRLHAIRDRRRSRVHERLDFRLLVESVADDQTDLGHDVTLMTGAPITVEGDALALKRSVVNLVDNAIKYGTRARLRLQVTNAQCVLEVDDDGPGISEALQNRVFEPFLRIEGLRNRETGGIGLALAAVRAIVLDHGGEVMVRNQQRRGTSRNPVSTDVGGVTASTQVFGYGSLRTALSQANPRLKSAANGSNVKLPGSHRLSGTAVQRSVMR